MRDYLTWHDDYDRPGSHLHLRLLVVQDLIARVLDERPPGPVRVISMCAGQGRDLLTVARRHRRGDDLGGRLVENDRRNVDAARAAIADLGISALEVVEADAGRSDAYVGATPADLVLACGIFGNITDDDVKTTVKFMPALCAPAAWVIWTRAPRGDDILERIEGWFEGAGFEPRAFVVGEGDLFGVGAAQFDGQPTDAEPGVRLFDFVR
ncbi:MAG: SAM-dependent methyltransferase [Acidimicrobiia bacterium]